MLRYFWVAAQWRRNVEAEARSRIRALQARIRPHFLFNSMNTIAALTRSDPARAEEAVEDLADLFRASLSDATSTVTLKEELELSRIYQRIEQHRLGDRLAVEWRIKALPLRARIPALSVQPLLENAIYHGIEQLAGGGTVVVEGRYDRATGIIELPSRTRWRKTVAIGPSIARATASRSTTSGSASPSHGEPGPPSWPVRRRVVTG
jgi:two-component system, LytTR family, sensor histidine kinase AlgZ